MVARGFRASLLVASLALLAGVAHAGTLHVPGSAATIQGAIVLAADGDTILVAPGAYPETIDFLGKRLVVQSDGGAAVTTIDGGGGGPVVLVDGAEPAGTSLRGFTITGGTEGIQVDVPFEGFHGFGGAGVYVGPDAQLELLDCTLTGNVMTAASTHGAALAVHEGAATLRGCTLSGNSAVENGDAISNMGYGGSINLYDCVVTHNSHGGSSEGYAIDIRHGKLGAANCLVMDNASGGLRGVGIGPWTGLTFEGNTGWGLRAFEFIGTEVYDCAFVGNGKGGARLSGVDSTSFHTLRRCVFAGDRLYAETPVHIEECTFDAAPVELHGAVLAGYVINTIARNVSPLVTGGVTPISYSDIQGGAPGPGNIDVDPQWVNPAAHDYRLQPTSPCINAGDPAALADANLTPADMGAFASAGWEDRGGANRWGNSYLLIARLAGQGALAAGQTVGLRLEGAPSALPTILLLGLDELAVPYKTGWVSGLLWPTLDLVVPGVVTNASGRWWITGTLPSSLPPGTTLLAQAWFDSPETGYSGSLSNAVRIVAP